MVDGPDQRDQLDQPDPPVLPVVVDVAELADLLDDADPNRLRDASRVPDVADLLDVVEPEPLEADGFSEHPGGDGEVAPVPGDAAGRSGNRLLDLLDRTERGWLAVIAVGLTVVLLATVGVVASVLRPPTSFTQRFDQPLATLDGQPAFGGAFWSVAGGTFDSNGDGLAAHPRQVGHPAIAVVDLGRPLTSFTVDLGSPARATGIVFRYQDPFNYWTLIAAPGYATWVIFERTAGTTHYVGNTSGLDLLPDRDTVTLTFSDAVVTIAINGQTRQTLSSRELATATGIGFIATDESTTRWDQISVRTG